MVSDPLPAVDEQSLRVSTQGKLNWNGSVFDLGQSGGRAGLTSRLAAFRETCARTGSEPSLRILPDDAVPHQMIVWLLDGIYESGIEQLHFP